MIAPHAAPFRGLLAVALALLLASCLFAPGKFVSTLDIRRDGQFRFTYAGEIHLLALSKLAAMDNDAQAFAAQPCRNDDGTETPCTAAELAEQRTAWEAERDSNTARRERDAETMKTILGGIDISDPRAAEELAARLRRQAGWRRVDYRGDGLFDVDFTIAGRLDHDFAFPTIEQFPMANAFVLVVLRKDGVVRVDAPGFGPGPGGEPLRMLTQSAAPKAARGADLPLPDGRFTLTTDAEILANNTDEGARADLAGQALDWTVNLRSAAAPMALLRLGAG